MSVKLTGTIIIPLDQQDTLVPLLNDHIAASLAESGNICFEITKNTADSTRFHLDEEFADQAAFEFHQTRSAASPWGERSKHLVRDFTKTED